MLKESIYGHITYIVDKFFMTSKKQGRQFLLKLIITITQNNQGDYKIKKLNGSNYSIWSIKLQMILTRNDLVPLIDAIEPNLSITNPTTQKVW